MCPWHVVVFSIHFLFTDISHLRAPRCPDKRGKGVHTTGIATVNEWTCYSISDISVVMATVRSNPLKLFFEWLAIMVGLFFTGPHYWVVVLCECQISFKNGIFTQY